MINLRLGLRGRIQQSYDLSKLRYELLYRRGVLRNQEPIVIYQKGKVGSSTVRESLRRLKLANPIYHVHYINNVDRRHKQIVNEFSLTHREYFARSRHFVVGQYLQREVKRGLKGKKWKVVSLIRNPLKQQISSFFQIADLIVPDFHERCRRRELSVDQLAAIFMKHVAPRTRSLDWFDQEMSPVFGIDVFARTFPVHKGYQIYHGERADLLLIRLEDLNRSASRAFKEFLGIDEFNLIDHNIASEKRYAVAYKEFKKRAILPKAYVNAICAAKSAQHFYTPKELDQFKASYHKQQPSIPRSVQTRVARRA